MSNKLRDLLDIMYSDYHAFDREVDSLEGEIFRAEGDIKKELKEKQSFYKIMRDNLNEYLDGVTELYYKEK